MTDRIQLFAIVVAIVQFILVFELVRAKRMLERYALLWLACSIVLFVLATWSQLLGVVADAVGIKTPSNALFLAALGFVLLLLLHFSIVISRLSDQGTVLAQHVALLQRALADATGGEPTASGAPPGEQIADPHEPPPTTPVSSRSGTSPDG